MYMDLFTNHSKGASIGHNRLWLAIQVANYRANYWQSHIKRSLSLTVRFILFEIINLLWEDKGSFDLKTTARGDPVCRKEDYSQYDNGLIFKEISSHSDQDKLKFIKSVCLKPGKLFDFPVSVEYSNSKCHFVRGWLKRFPWLAYSKFLDGAFCLPCVLFGVQCGRKKVDKSYETPLTLSTSAMSRFTKHASGKCEIHSFSVTAMDNFLRNMTRESVAIDQQISNLLQQEIKRHCEILKSLFTTIIFGGRNNIALMQRSTRWWSSKCQSFWKLSGTIRI